VGADEMVKLVEAGTPTDAPADPEPSQVRPPARRPVQPTDRWSAAPSCAPV